VTALRVASLIIIAGSIVFLIAAFSPITRVFAMKSAEDKWQLISASTNAWVIAQVMFALGATATAVGVLLAGGALQGKPTDAVFYVAGALLLVGAIAWSWHAYLRGHDPRAFVDGTLPGWHFVLYSLLTLAAFGLLGYSLLKMGFPSWSAWVLMAGSSVLLVLYLVFRDMPPAVYYLMGLVLGIVLHRGA
jgi:hypothetical protein